MFRKKINFDHIGLGEVVDIFDTRDGWDGCPSTNLEDDLVCLPIDADRVGALQATVTFEDCQIVHAFHPAGHAVVRLFDDCVFARFELFHINGDVAAN
jgi:hypothetical protein